MTLDEYLVKRKETNEAFGKRIGKSAEWVRQIRHGLSDCSARTCRLIEAETSGTVTFSDIHAARVSVLSSVQGTSSSPSKGCASA